MLYNQPFDKPSDPDASYVNANPAAGIEGSIPSAQSIEYPQREIVEVIQWAYDNDLPNCEAPTNNDLTQLRQAIEGFLAARFITTAVTKTVHGTTPDFANLHDAFEWLSRYTITQTGSVTFMVRAGQHVYTTPLEVNHPNSARVFIQGAALLGASPQWNNLSVTGYHSSTDGTNQITYLRSVYATELQFTGGVTGFITYTAGVTLRYLLITGSQTIAPPDGGIALDLYSDLNIDGCAIWGFGYSGVRINNCRLRMTSALSFTVSYCGSMGIYLLGGLYEAAVNSETIIVSNDDIGIFNLGGFCWCGVCVVRGTGTGNAGVVLEQGAMFATQANSRFSNNGTNGVYMAGSGTWVGQTCLYQSNGAIGFVMDGGGKAWIGGSTVNGNGGSFDIYVNGGANLVAVGAAYGTITPAVNTWGNANSYIIY